MAINVWPVNAVTGAPSYDGRELRQVGSALLAGATTARPLGARSGVRPGTPVTTVTATPTVWTVLPHAGVLDLQTSAIAGPYQYAIDANVTGAVTAANATNPRKDIVYVKLDDPAEGDGSSVPAVTPLYLAGTAAAVPVPPATPARSMVLAIISVPVSGGGSPTVQFTAPYAAGPGGIITVRSSTERDVLNGWATAENPVYADCLYDGTLQRNDGSGWVVMNPRVLPSEGLVGTVMPTTARPIVQAFPVQATTNASGLITVTFPVAFTVAPTVVAMSVNYTAVNPVINAATITTTSCQLLFSGVYSTAVLANVIAIGW